MNEDVMVSFHFHGPNETIILLFSPTVPQHINRLLSRKRVYRLTKVECSASLPLFDTQLVDSHNRSPHVEPTAAVFVSGHKVKDRSTSSGSCRADEYSVASTQKVEDGYAEIHTAGEMFPTLRNKYVLPWPWCVPSE